MGAKTYFAYARHAIVAALQELGARPNDTIAIPELICRDVLASFHQVGVRPVFYPVDRQLQPVWFEPVDKLRFVLMVNYFGFPQDVNSFRSLWPSAQIVEDNAHGFLSRDPFGNELGTRTAAGVTSCRKTLRIPDGAWLHTERISSDSKDLGYEDRKLPLSFAIRSIASRLERATGIPINFGLRTMLRQGRRLATGSMLPKSDQRSEFELPAVIRISQKSLNSILSIDADREVDRRRGLFGESLNFALAHEVEPVFTTLPDGTSPYGFAFFSPSAKNPMTRFASRHHCEVITWPDLPSAVSVDDDHHYRQLRVVNFL